MLENQIRTLERARSTGNYAAESSEIVLENIKDNTSSDEGDDEFDNNDSRRGNKRMKTNSY